MDIFWTNLDDFLNRKNICPNTKIATLEFLVFWGVYISPVQEIVKIGPKNCPIFLQSISLKSTIFYYIPTSFANFSSK